MPSLFFLHHFFLKIDLIYLSDGYGVRDREEKEPTHSISWSMTQVTIVAGSAPAQSQAVSGLKAKQVGFKNKQTTRFAIPVLTVT